jgi:hypothetical protein
MEIYIMARQFVLSSESTYTFFPNEEITEQDKAARDRWLDGYTDGSVNAMPDIRYHKSDDAYILGYIEGLEFWASNPANTKIKPICTMCVHFSDRQGRCTKLDIPMDESNPACFEYEEYCPF